MCDSLVAFILLKNFIIAKLLKQLDLIKLFNFLK